MTVSPDLLFQNLSTVQSDKQPTPKTVVAATTIAPETFMTIITGTTSVATITPPAEGTHMLCLVFESATPDLLTTGNILVGLTTIVVNRPVLVVFNPISSKYYVVAT